jgi:hypothetical protein
MAGWHHSGGFSLDAAVRIEGLDRAGLERLLRYCARPLFALERLEQARQRTTALCVLNGGFGEGPAAEEGR